MPSGFWSTATLRDRLPDIVQPFDDQRLDVCAYHLSMGPEAFVSSDRPHKDFLDANAHVTIPPGQFAQLLTLETIEMPHDAIGFISLRTGRKSGGLINVSGFHVDPGYEGRLIFSVFNAGTGPIIISYGDPVFALWLASLDGRADVGYDGDRQGLTKIRDKDVAPLTRAVPSAATLEQRVTDVEKDVRETRRAVEKDAQNIRWVLGITITLALAVVALLVAVLTSIPGSNSDQALASQHDAERPTVSLTPR